MACIITYKNNKYSQQEFEKYFKNNFNEFINEFLSQDIEGFKEFVKGKSDSITDKIYATKEELTEALINLSYTNNVYKYYEVEGGYKIFNLSATYSLDYYYNEHLFTDKNEFDKVNRLRNYLNRSLNTRTYFHKEQAEMDIDNIVREYKVGRDNFSVVGFTTKKGYQLWKIKFHKPDYMSEEELKRIRNDEQIEKYYSELSEEDKLSIELLKAQDDSFQFSLDYVDNLRDFVPKFNNNSTDQSTMIFIEENKLTNIIINSMITNHEKGKPFKYEYGKKFIFPESLTQSELINKVREQIIPYINKYEKEFKGKCKSFVTAIYEARKDDVLTEEKFIHIANHIFGKEKYSNAVINELVDKLSLDEPFLYALEYKELANNEALKHLYNPIYEGLNPLVIVHAIENGEYVVSIVDITTKPIKKNYFDLNDNKILSILENDSESDVRGLKLSNHDEDIRLFMLGVTMMKMMQMSLKDNKPTIRFNNVGVMSINNNKINNKMAYDINSLIRQIKLVADNKILQNFIINEDIKSLLNNKSVYEYEYKQSYFTILKQHIKESITNGKLSTAKEKFMAEQLKVLDSNLNINDIKRILRNRLTYLQSQYKGDEYLHSQEFIDTALALKELDYNFNGTINDIEDMSALQKSLQSSHMLSDENLQWLRDIMFSQEKATVRNVIKLKKEIMTELESFISRNGSKYSILSLIKSNGSDIFKHMFKKKNVQIQGTNKFVEVTLPILHYTIDDPETKKLVDTGYISKEDLAFTEKLVNQLENEYIKCFEHTLSKQPRYMNPDGTSKVTKENVMDALYASGYIKGNVIVLQKSVNELLFSGNASNAWQRYLSQTGNTSIILDETINKQERKKSDIKDDISSYILNQLNQDRLFYNAGLIIDHVNSTPNNTVYILKDENANNMMSTNLETIYNHITLSIERKIDIENRVIPAYNSVLSILKMYENTTDIDLKNSIQYVKDYYKRNILSRDADERLIVKSTPIILGRKKDEKGNIIKKGITVGGTTDISKIVKSLVHTSSFFVLGYSVTTGVKSLIYNELSMFINGLASSLSGASKSNIALPGIIDLLKAQEVLIKGITGYNPETKKLIELGKKFGLINRTERDMISNPLINKTSRNWWDATYAHILNSGTDMGARLISMAAVLMKYKSWDAYTYNEQTGEIDYDITKDGMYSVDGHIDEANGKHVLVQSLKERLIDQGQMTNEDTVFPVGLDDTLVDGTLKWFADKFIIGNMDSKSKNLLGHTTIGVLISQFRMFQLTKLENAGLFAGKRNTTQGVAYKAIKDENGNWISTKELLEIEGVWQSFWTTVDTLFVQHKSYKELSQITKFNNAKLSVQMSLMVLLYALIKGGFDDDDDKFAWIYSDITIGPTVAEIFSKNPLPSLSIYSDLINATFNPSVEKIFKKIGLTRNFIPLINLNKE
jgi:hypothetical protein